MAKKLLAGGNTFEDHTKEFILRAQKRFDLTQTLKRSNSIPTINYVESTRLSSVLSPTDLNENRKTGPLMDGRPLFANPDEVSMNLEATLEDDPEREEETVDSLQSSPKWNNKPGKRFKRQTDNLESVVTQVTNTVSQASSTSFDRVLEALSQQSNQLAESYQNLKRMTENLASGLRDLQAKANISTDSLRSSAATLGSDLRDGLSNLVDRINSTISGITLDDLQQGLKSVMTRSTPEYAASEPSVTQSSGDQLSIESVVSELLTPGQTTTASPLEHVKQQFSSFIQGAEEFLKRNTPHITSKNGGQDDSPSLFTRISNFASNRRRKQEEKISLPSASTASTTL